MRNIVTVTPGQRFGRLTVIREAEHQYGHRYILCKCDCGNEKSINLNSLVKGTSNSCGCYRKEYMANKNYKHGCTPRGKIDRLHHIWSGMKNRCLNPNIRGYKHYGGRGIKICDEWVNDFTVFRTWALANGYADNLTLDRINVNGNYEPSNCRWATIKEQSNNTRVNHRVTYKGETHTLSEWGDKLGINPNIIGRRLSKGMPVEKAFYVGDLRKFRYKEMPI